MLSFCRGDCLDNTCIKCISVTAEGLMIKCPNQKAVYSKEAFNPPCFIPYSLVQCTREADISDVYRFMDITMDQDQFDRTQRNLMEAPVARALTEMLRLKFAAGTIVLPNFQTVFALLQCSLDLSQVDCQSCLWECIDNYKDMAMED